MYGVSTTPPPPDDHNNNNYFPIDDLLDFSNSNDEDSFLSSSSSSTAAVADNHHLPPLPSSSQHFPSFPHSSPPSDFTDHLLVPSDDVAELEWLSQFVEDSFTDFPASSVLHMAGTSLDTSSLASSTSSSCRSDRSKGGTSPSPWTSDLSGSVKPRQHKTETSRAVAEEDGGVRRCSHCASEKTPQWRTGPLGPKTLCNACGVRYKSGRLVPEYRPAASPTFVLTQHSNSHRKVLELRRQKEEMLRQQQQQKFGVC